MTSNILDLVCLAMPAAPPIPIDTHGRIYPVQLFTPTVGSQPSRRAKNITRSSANQKLGMDAQNNDTTIERLSFQVFWFVAAIIPAGIPSTIEIRMPI